MRISDPALEARHDGVIADVVRRTGRLACRPDTSETLGRGKYDRSTVCTDMCFLCRAPRGREITQTQCFTRRQARSSMRVHNSLSLMAPALLCVRPRAFCVASAASKRVVFLGTPSVAARSLELLLQGSRDGRGGDFEIAAVVSQPPARTGRKMKLTPSPVHELAEAEGLRLLTPPNAKDEEFLATLADIKPDLCVTAAYGCFLPQRFLDLPHHGTLNIHPSLLPLYRGAAPIQRCLEAGDPITGVTVAFTVLAMDAGPVLRQVERKLGGDEQAPELLLEMFEAGTEQLLEALPSVWDGSCEAALRPQDADAATKAAKVQKEEAEVRLDVMSAAEIHNRLRGFAGGQACGRSLTWLTARRLCVQSSFAHKLQLKIASCLRDANSRSHLLGRHCRLHVLMGAYWRCNSCSSQARSPWSPKRSGMASTGAFQSGSVVMKVALRGVDRLHLRRVLAVVVRRTACNLRRLRWVSVLRCDLT